MDADHSNPSSGTMRRFKRGLSRSPVRTPVRTPQSLASDMRTPSPISIGSVRYRSLSPVYDPAAKLYPPHVMNFPQIFVPAMDESLYWGRPLLDDDYPEEECSGTMDWDSEASITARNSSFTPAAHSFDPRVTGSFPPRRLEMLLFPPKRKAQCKLEDLDVDEDHTRQPETDVQPAEGTRDEVRAIDAPSNKGRATKFVLPLELFDNSDMDLIHPSLLIQAVSPPTF